MGRTVAYPPEVKAKALELYIRLGAAATGRKLGIPRQTIRQWAMKNGVQTQVESVTRKATEVARLTFHAKRERFRERLLDMAAVCVEDIPNCEPRDRQSNAVAAGILVDKLRLELGESTSRTETHSTIAHLDAELAHWVEVVRSDTTEGSSLADAQVGSLPAAPLQIGPVVDPEVTDREGKEGEPVDNPVDD